MRQLALWYQRYSADLAALAVANIWGVSFVFRKAALGEFEVAAFNLLRFVGMPALCWVRCCIARGLLRGASC